MNRSLENETIKILNESYDIEEDTYEGDTYESGIFAQIEEAFREYGLNFTRFIDAGIMTDNIGWVVEGQQISCDGSYLDDEYKREYLGESKNN